MKQVIARSCILKSKSESETFLAKKNTSQVGIQMSRSRESLDSPEGTKISVSARTTHALQVTTVEREVVPVGGGKEGVSTWLV